MRAAAAGSCLLSAVRVEDVDQLVTHFAKMTEEGWCWPNWLHELAHIAKGQTTILDLEI